MINESIVASVIQLDTEGKTMSELVASMYPLNIPAPSSMGKYTYANLLRETDFVRDQVLKRKIVKTTTSDVRDFKWLRLKSDARNPPMDTKGEPLRVVSRWWSYASRGFIKSQNNMYICWSSSSNLWPIYQVARFCHICLSVGPYIMPTVACPASAMFFTVLQTVSHVLYTRSAEVSRMSSFRLSLFVFPLQLSVSMYLIHHIF